MSRPVLFLSLLVLACGEQSITEPQRPVGEYQLQSVDGVALPLPNPGCCSTLDSGSVRVRALDTIEVRHASSAPPSNGLPGMEVIGLGYYVLRRAGAGYALDAGIGTTVTPPHDTLYVEGETVRIVEGRPRFSTGGRRTWVFTR